jgi:ADP-heptose:LPS heptosyltransferase
MEPNPPDASPVKSVIEELDGLRSEFRSALMAYASRIEEEIGLVQKSVGGLANRKKIPPARLHDLRDMLTLLRKFSIKPEKGRRKDLKKIDALVGDLTMLIEPW